MTPPPDDDATLEPWPGYAKQDADERKARFDFKVSEARLRGDLLYAKALCVAVAATEAAGGDAALATHATKAAKVIDGYGSTLFEEAGGWTPK